MRNGGAAHKNMEAPRSIDRGASMSWHFSHSPVTPMIRVGPWRRAAPKAQDRVPRRGTTLCSGKKEDVRRSIFLACHEGRSGGSLLADR